MKEKLIRERKEQSTLVGDKQSSKIKNKKTETENQERAAAPTSKKSDRTTTQPLCKIAKRYLHIAHTL